MSYNTWHDYGYGICVDDIDTTVDRVFELIRLAPNFEKDFYEWLEDFKQDEDPESTMEDFMTMDVFDEYEDQNCYTGLAVILKEVIKECEDVQLLCCDDYNCNHYLIFSVTYPWYMTDKEKNMTEEDMRLLIAKYASVLTDANVKIEYQSVENGG